MFHAINITDYNLHFFGPYDQWRILTHPVTSWAHCVEELELDFHNMTHPVTSWVHCVEELELDFHNMTHPVTSWAHCVEELELDFHNMTHPVTSWAHCVEELELDFHNMTHPVTSWAHCVEELELDFHNMTILPSGASFPPHILKIVAKGKVSGTPHVLKLWLGVSKGMLPVKYICPNKSDLCQ